MFVIHNEFTAKRNGSCHVMFLNKRPDTFIMLTIPLEATGSLKLTLLWVWFRAWL